MSFIISILLIIACLCLLTKNNFLLYFIALELIVLAINLNFAFFSVASDDAMGFYIALLLLALAAIDTAIGLSLLVKFFRSNIMGGTKMSSLIFLKG